MSSQPESAHIETLDETPDEMLGTTNHEAEAFTKAIDKIVKANYGSSKSKPKLWEPDPFDGSDSRKLRTFILQSKLNFQDRPDQFQDNTTKELETNFGTYDPVGEAEAELEGLHMHESHQATNYFIKFQQLATHVQWGKPELCRRAYNGLTKCIKDDMVHHHKPNTLTGLQKLLQAIGAQYWE